MSGADAGLSPNAKSSSVSTPNLSSYFSDYNKLAINNAKETMAFNAQEAQKSRDWQEYMSNTAHQREVADLLKAGLNPVLSANGGASSGSGASASGDNAKIANEGETMASMYTSLMTALINQQTQTAVANINAKSAIDVAKQYGQNSINSQDYQYNNSTNPYYVFGQGMVGLSDWIKSQFGAGHSYSGKKGYKIVKG